ncbi:pilus assembly protein PilF, partial [Nostoc sp. 2RC]|nr:pilus assembly protein PilF [Nostoc sp. 2RC]
MIANIVPTGELLLAELDIDPSNLTVPSGQLDDYIAVINWLTDYEPNPDAPNLEKVRGCLEAFHHLCQVEAWVKASNLLFTRLNTIEKEELHNQLNTWGYYHEQYDLYTKLLELLEGGLKTLFIKDTTNIFYNEQAE